MNIRRQSSRCTVPPHKCYLRVEQCIEVSLALDTRRHMISASVARFPLLWDEANGSLKLLKTQLLKILVSARRRDGDKHTYVHLYREIVTCACYCKGSSHYPIHMYIHNCLPAQPVQ